MVGSGFPTLDRRGDSLNRVPRHVSSELHQSTPRRLRERTALVAKVGWRFAIA